MAENESPETEKPETATEDTDKAMDDRIARIANKAMSAQLSRAIPALRKDLQASFGEVMAPIHDTLSKLQPSTREESTEEHAESGNSALAKLKNENAKMQATLKQLTDRLAQSEAEKQKEHESRLRNEEDRVLLETLSENGLTGKRAQAVALLLRQGEHAIKRGDDGAIVFEVPGPGGYPDHVSVSEGVKKWLESEGKEFLPSRGTAGSGAADTKQPQSRRPPQGKRPEDMTPEERRKARSAAAWEVITRGPGGQRQG